MITSRTMSPASVPTLMATGDRKTFGILPPAVSACVCRTVSDTAPAVESHIAETENWGKPAPYIHWVQNQVRS